MALADYRLCDQCGGKAFYDANLNYDPDRLDKHGGWKLDYVGDMAVLCDECAKDFEVIVQPKEQDAPPA